MGQVQCDLSADPDIWAFTEPAMPRCYDRLFFFLGDCGGKEHWTGFLMANVTFLARRTLRPCQPITFTLSYIFYEQLRDER